MKKEQKIREGLNDLLSKREDSSKVEGVLNRLTDIDRSVSDRLWVLWTRIKGMREEAEELTNLIGHQAGSRLSQVIDILNQAETLTGETMSLTMGQSPSDKFRIRDTGENWEVWDDEKGIGIRFKKWDGQTKTRLLFVRTAEAYVRGEESFDDLISFARERFPQEFKSRES